jgi:hypothetical protein
VVEAFRGVAQAALAAFDEVASAWVPPSMVKLQKMQADDAVNAAVKQVADAQAEVDQAVADAQNMTRNEGESDADFAKRQADAQTRIQTAVTQLGEAQRAYTEFQLGLNAAQEQTAHDRQMAADREHFAARLLQIQTELAKHPEEYAKSQRQILALMKRYHIPMYKAGEKLASRFADGLDDGIAKVIATARKLANELEKITGPVGGEPVSPGTAIGGGHGAGVPSGVGGRTSSMNVNLTVNAATDDPRRLAMQVRDELRKMNRNNALDPLAV